MEKKKKKIHKLFQCRQNMTGKKTFRHSKFLQTLLKRISSYCTITLYSKSNCSPSCGTAQSSTCVALAFDEAVKNKPPNCSAFNEPGQGSPDGIRDRPRVPRPALTQLRPPPLPLLGPPQRCRQGAPHRPQPPQRRRHALFPAHRLLARLAVPQGEKSRCACALPPGA